MSISQPTATLASTKPDDNGIVLEEGAGVSQDEELRKAREALRGLVVFAVEGKDRGYAYSSRKQKEIAALFIKLWPLVRQDTNACSNGGVAAAFATTSRGEDGGDQPVAEDDVHFVVRVGMSPLRADALETLSKPHLAFVRMYLPEELKGSA